MNGQSKAMINLLKGWPNPTLLPKVQIKAAASKVLSDSNLSTQGLLYGPLPGSEPLRVQLAAWLTKFYKPERPIGWERICISGGASQNLACILQVFSDPVYTRNIWMVSPTYFLACRVFEDSGFHGRLRAVPEDDEGIDIDFLRSKLQQSEREAVANGNTKPLLKPPRPWSKIYRHIIYAVPTFANPSSKTMSLERRQQLVRIAREYDALVITDDVYDQLQWTVSSTNSTSLEEAIEPRIVDIDRFLDGGAQRSGADGFGNAVSSGSFSKIVAPGGRSGWAEGTETFIFGLSNVYVLSHLGLIGILTDLRRGSTNSGSAPSQLTASFMTELLESGELEKHLHEKLQPAYARRYRAMIAAIKDVLVPMGVTLPQSDRAVVGGYFIWFSLPDPIKADDFAAQAQAEEQVIVGPGSLFEVYGDAKEGTLSREVRVCFAWVEEALLSEGIARLGRVIKTMRSAKLDGGKSANALGQRGLPDPRYQ
ncbi:hypothetical protein MMC13_007802 [Lambiella insularis]|nr:hypothetical protein [Lambiella insularis]